MTCPVNLIQLDSIPVSRLCRKPPFLVCLLYMSLQVANPNKSSKTLMMTGRPIFTCPMTFKSDLYFSWHTFFIHICRTSHLHSETTAFLALFYSQVSICLHSHTSPLDTVSSDSRTLDPSTYTNFQQRSAVAIRNPPVDEPELYSELQFSSRVPRRRRGHG